MLRFETLWEPVDRLWASVCVFNKNILIIIIIIPNLKTPLFTGFYLKESLGWSKYRIFILNSRSINDTQEKELLRLQWNFNGWEPTEMFSSHNKVCYCQYKTGVMASTLLNFSYDLN